MDEKMVNALYTAAAQLYTRGLDYSIISLFLAEIQRVYSCIKNYSCVTRESKEIKRYFSCGEAYYVVYACGGTHRSQRTRGRESLCLHHSKRAYTKTRLSSVHTGVLRAALSGAEIGAASAHAHHGVRTTHSYIESLSRHTKRPKSWPTRDPPGCRHPPQTP